MAKNVQALMSHFDRLARQLCLKVLGIELLCTPLSDQVFSGR